MQSEKPLINVVTITNRPLFREFLQYNFDIQDYPNKKLIVIEGEGTVGYKYQKGLEQCEPGMVTFFDDDDISSSKRLSWCFSKSNGKLMITSGSLHWVNVEQSKVAIRGAWIWSLGLYPVDMALEQGFNPEEHIGADTTFSGAFRTKDPIVITKPPPIIMCLSHSTNAWNIATRTSNYYWSHPFVNPSKEFYSDLEWDRIVVFVKGFKKELFG
jgi:hypothetical protein